MNINVTHSILLIIVAGIMSLICRATPFLIFSGKREMPKALKRITDALPPAIMAVLVIYCLKDAIAVINYSSLAALIAILSVVGIHLWKRNTLLSISVGTIIYMIMIRL